MEMKIALLLLLSLSVCILAVSGRPLKDVEGGDDGDDDDDDDDDVGVTDIHEHKTDDASLAKPDDDDDHKHDEAGHDHGMDRALDHPSPVVHALDKHVNHDASSDSGTSHRDRSDHDEEEGDEDDGDDDDDDEDDEE